MLETRALSDSRDPTLSLDLDAPWWHSVDLGFRSAFPGSVHVPGEVDG